MTELFRYPGEVHSWVLGQRNMSLVFLVLIAGGSRQALLVFQRGHDAVWVLMGLISAFRLVGAGLFLAL